MTTGLPRVRIRAGVATRERALTTIYALLAVAAGALFPVQTALNAQLGRSVGGALVATIISFAVGLALLVAVWLVASREWPAGAVMRSLPPFLFIGGTLGAAYLGFSVFLVPRLGSAATLCLAVMGQILMSLVVDRLGLFGLVTRELSPMRLAGAGFVALGVFIVRFY